MDKMALSWTLVAQMLMFLSAMGILSHFLFKPMMAVFAKRREMAEGPRERAAAMESDVTAAKQTVETALAQARTEAGKLRNALLSKAQGEERSVVGAAREQAGRSVAAAREDINQAVRRAREQLTVEAETLAEELANSLLKV
mgnify:FL=1